MLKHLNMCLEEQVVTHSTTLEADSISYQRIVGWGFISAYVFT
jgi:hypothetical protein